MGHEGGDTFPICFEHNVVPQKFEVDAFNLKECSHDDISPCFKEDSDRRLRYPPHRTPAFNKTEKEAQFRAAGKQWVESEHKW